MATERQYELHDAKLAGKKLLLIDTKTRELVKIGDIVTSFRGETAIVASFDARRLYVRWEGSESSSSYFPSVFGCEVVIEGEGK